MTIIRLQELRKSGVITQQAQLPSEWLTSTFAPGFPIQPFTSPTEVEVPREIDYPIAVNASLQPRTGYGLMPFSALLMAYENISEVRMPVQIILRELNGFVPKLVDPDGNEINDHPYQWMTISPDRQTPFNVWMTRFLKNSYVFDTGAVFQDMSHGHIEGLHYVDGSTLFIMVDEHGRVPLPGDRSEDPTIIKRYVEKTASWVRKGNTYPLKTPAYAQVIKGTPFGWYSQDDIWYRPRSRRMDSPYGESFIEQSWAWVLIIANITAFELAHYREGNMPEGWFESPNDWSLERIAAFEMVNNARMSGGPAERMRSRFYPAGFKWHETKKADFPVKLYEKARDNVLNAIGLPPSEIGNVPGQGLGGKGFQEAMQSALFRNALIPPKAYLEGMFNEMLERDGVDDAKFELGLPTQSVDPDKQREGVIAGFQSGLLSFNDALGQLGLTPVPGGDKHVIIQAGTVIVLEDYLGDNPPAPTVGVGNTPAVPDQIAPVPAKTEPAATFTPDDFATAVEMLRSGSLTPATFTSIPSASKGDGHLKHPKMLDGRFAPKARVTSPSAMQIGREIGIDFNVIDPTQFEMGFIEEYREHPSFQNNPEVAATLVLDHLRENPDYYKNVACTKCMKCDEPPTKFCVWAEGNAQAWHCDKHFAEFKAEHPGDIDYVYDVPDGDVRKCPAYKADGVAQPPFSGTTVATASTVVKLAPIVKQMPSIDMPHKPKEEVLEKHCGVCPEDDEYYQAPIARETDAFEFPELHHANEVEIVAMIPDNLEPKPALFKPEGGEADAIIETIGGHQSVREEAAYLLDRSLGFMLVPVTYVAEVDGERGAVVYYTHAADEPYEDVTMYDPAWVERAAVLDYAMTQLDRQPKHNYFTHPDDPRRMILFDNGYSFPENPDFHCQSPFCAAMGTTQLADETLKAMLACYKDEATWRDISSLVGPAAMQKARKCLGDMINNKSIIVQAGTTTS